MNVPPSIRLCSEHLCEVFWNEKLLTKIESKEWREEIRRKSPVSPPFIDYKGNTIVETQELSWISVNDNEEKARLPRYITDDGRIGGSGDPDPKKIMIDDTKRYRLTRPSRQEACNKCGRIGHDWPNKP
jgi:hypothetical protein